MTDLEERIYEFLEEYRELLNTNKFDELYNKLITVQGIKNNELTNVLYHAGLNVLQYLSYIPAGYDSYNKTLMTLTIPKKIKYIADYAYFRCSNLRALEFEKGSECTLIQDSAFSNCTMLSNIRFAEGLLNIEPYSFSGCRSLTTLVLPNSLHNIMTKAFADCTSLTNVYTGLSLESIDDAAFMHNSKLEYVKIENPKIQLGKSVFVDCDNLNVIDFNGYKSDWRDIVNDCEDHCNTWKYRSHIVTRVHCLDGDVHIDGTDFEQGIIV